MHKTYVYRAHGGLGARLWFGIAIFGLGVVWTLDNLGFVESESVVRLWPLIVVAFGLTRLVGLGTPQRIGAGVVWMSIGALLLVMRAMPWDFWEMWPLFLIVAGVAIVWRAFSGPRARRSAHGGTGEPGDEAGGSPHIDTFSAVAVWSGVDRKSASQQFRYGDYTAVMGGGSVNLIGAKPVPGGAVVDLLVVMGGVEVIVPEDWTVVNEVFAFMGGVEDGRKTPSANGDRTLILKGFCMMGGVEIKN